MDESQHKTLLHAIAISSGSHPQITPLLTPQSRAAAFTTLEQFKSFTGRIPIALTLLRSERHTVPVGTVLVDVTAATKMYVLGIVQVFLKREYGKLEEHGGERKVVKEGILMAARQLVVRGGSLGGEGISEEEMRFLAVKIATLIADVVIRDFPQRWSTFIADVFSPPEQGGLWLAQPYDPPAETWSSSSPVKAQRYGPTIGIKIVLECFSRIVEDCTDGDFNAKVSTRRRSDVLIGLNEVHGLFLPRIFDFMSQQYAVLCGCKNTIREMQNYLVSGGRTLLQMTNQEKALYDQQLRKRDAAGRLVSDCLGTIEKCCQSMPTDWMLGTLSSPTTPNTTTDTTTTTPPTTNPQPPPPQNDFLTALLHLIHEETLQLQVQAVTCLQYLVLRKLEPTPWLQLTSALTNTISAALESSAQQSALDATLSGSTTGPADDPNTRLVQSLPFHRGVSKLLSVNLSSHMAHISTDKTICDDGRGENYEIVSRNLNLMTEMLAHPSPRVAGEQIQAWIVLLKDPILARPSSSHLLHPFLQRVLSTFIQRRVKIRWDDVLEGRHPLTVVYEASFDDEDEYEAFTMELRSRATQIFRTVSGIGPQLSAELMLAVTRDLFTKYGVGEGGVGRDHLDNNGSLTQSSTAVMELENLCQPLDTVLQGLPLWALDVTKTNDASFMDPGRVLVRNAVRSCLAEVAGMIVGWKPMDTWLRSRRAMMLDALKYYWRYDQTTLPTGVDALLTYLGAEDSPEQQQQQQQQQQQGNSNTTTSIISKHLSSDIISLRKRSGAALISVSKKVPHLLVMWLGDLADRAKTLLSCTSLLPTNKMHLIEFLSCVATAVQDPVGRSNFVSNVLSEDLMVLETAEVKEALASPEGMLAFMGISDPSRVRDGEFVRGTTEKYVKLFSAFNHLLSVGKRCHDAARKRPNGAIPMQESVLLAQSAQLKQEQDAALNNTTNNTSSSNTPPTSPSPHQPPPQPPHFSDEGTVSLSDLELNDPFIPLWPRILPSLLRALDVLFSIWHPKYQAPLLSNAIQRYAYAISDDEAYLAKNQGSQSGGGVFGEGGTAGSVVAGWDRRGGNLAPKWSGWFNELRNTCIQLLGLLASQRALYAPELAGMYPEFVGVVASPLHLQAMEHRHISQFIKQFVDYVLHSCPSQLYQSHLKPLLKPFFQHLYYRLECTWAPVQEQQGSNGGQAGVSTKPLSTGDCAAASELAMRGGDQWIVSYYARGGLFCGDLDAVIAEAAVERVRVELSRCFSDVIQSALALKGDWALVLANQSKEEQAIKRNDASRLTTGPSTKSKQGNVGPVNADGTPRSRFHLAIEARKTLRIRELCRFLLLGDESIAGFLVLTVFQCLVYPDAYTCRRCTRICHRILETVAWAEHYTKPLVENMFLNAVRVVITEPKWMVGLELDMINLIRNIYCRLVLGQTLLPGGQGAGMQQNQDPTTSHFEQSKTVDNPLLGGGILCVKSDLPRKVLSDLPGITPAMVLALEQSLSQKRTAKEQKDALCDFLRIAAENLKESECDTNSHFGVLGRATASESLLNRNNSDTVVALPEKLITHSMMMKKDAEGQTPVIPSLNNLFKPS